MKPGSVLIIHNMPYPAVVKNIEKYQDGYTGHHCAIILDKEKEHVYDAQPPKVRKSTLGEYLFMLRDWSETKQQWRKEEGRPLKVEVWTGEIDSEELDTMLLFSESLLGYHYSMILGYFWPWDIKRWYHCSEFVARNLYEIGMTWKKPFNKITPQDVHLKMVAEGWECNLVYY